MNYVHVCVCVCLCAAKAMKEGKRQQKQQPKAIKIKIKGAGVGRKGCRERGGKAGALQNSALFAAKVTTTFALFSFLLLLILPATGQKEQQEKEKQTNSKVCSYNTCQSACKGEGDLLPHPQSSSLFLTPW